MEVKYGDKIGRIIRTWFETNGRENYWKLEKGRVTSIIINSKGKRAKTDYFRTLDAKEIEFNTNWMLETKNLILPGEYFVLTDELQERVTKWIEKENKKNENKQV